MESVSSNQEWLGCSEDPWESILKDIGSDTVCCCPLATTGPLSVSHSKGLPTFALDQITPLWSHSHAKNDKSVFISLQGNISWVEGLCYYFPGGGGWEGLKEDPRLLE